MSISRAIMMWSETLHQYTPFLISLSSYSFQTQHTMLILVSSDRFPTSLKANHVLSGRTIGFEILFYDLFLKYQENCSQKQYACESKYIALLYSHWYECYALFSPIS
jgi:hypothetical protein